MPIISVQMLGGRPPSKKRALIKALAEATVSALDVPIGSVRIVLSDVEPEDWGIGADTKADLLARGTSGS